MRRAVTSLTAVLATLLAGGAPAAAHPFGPPPVARLDASGREAVISWSAAEDDYTVLGGVLGVLDARQTFVYDADGRTVAGPPATGEQLAMLDGSDELRRYLVDNVSVRQGADDCPLRVEGSRLASDGVELVATCPRPVAELVVGITLLHDLHPAYRTVGLVGDAGTRTLFTASEPVRTISFGAPGAPGTASSAAWVVLALVGLASAGGAGLWLRRRRAGGEPAR